MEVMLDYEKKIRRKGFSVVAGLDEAGRGPLAGPVVACAVIVSPGFKWRQIDFDLGGVRDSKKMTAKKREKVCKFLTSCPKIEWGIGVVSEKTIDRINIFAAAKLAMIKAVKKLKKTPDFLILDGKMKIDLPISQVSVVKADEKILSCMAAGIIAKVVRDGIMRRYHEKYPQYGFGRHKGYYTKLHEKMLKKHGLCPIHRRTFKPAALIKNAG